MGRGVVLSIWILATARDGELVDKKVSGGFTRETIDFCESHRMLWCQQKREKIRLWPQFYRIV